MEKPLDYAIIGLVLAVTQLEVIYVKVYFHLRPVDQLVGNAWIVRVYLKPYACETLGELAIVDHTGHHCPI